MAAFSRRRTLFLAIGALAACSCSRSPSNETSKLTVAAAANLTGMFDEVAAAFKKQSGVEVVLSYGSTAQLAQQIENGAPFDVFAAADTEHVDQLIMKNKIASDSRAVYARGQLALWIPEGEKLGIRGLKDLGGPEVKFIALAQPELAPYGKAAVEAMKSAGLWETFQPKMVYANNISLSRQFAATGNANAAFTAYSLVLKDPGVVVKVDPSLYKPIEQAAGVVSSSAQAMQARQFLAFLGGVDGRKILSANGYLVR
jgi:molybdate transport system substrate-binding protein